MVSERPVKILIINYRYFVSGGPERYLFNLQDLLTSHGHAVIPFSIRYAKNEPTEYARYFVPPLSNSEEVYFKDQTWNASAFLRTLGRSFYSFEVEKALDRLITEHRPDFAIVLHYLRKLSPSVLSVLSRHRIPFAVRISDFAMVCPNAHLVRDGAVCELCVKGSMLNSVRYRCVQGSLGASAVNYAATKFHAWTGMYDHIRKFILPSGFTRQKMIEAGWEADRLVHVPTFVQPGETVPASSEKDIDVIFVGRVEPLKGVHLLIDAMRWINEMQPNSTIRCSIVGAGAQDYMEQLQRTVTEHNIRSVTFHGNLPKNEVFALLRRARIAVVPSVWYDNMPNAALESLAAGVPVIASDHGSLPEVVHDGVNGALFEPNNAVELGKKIVYLLSDRQSLSAMGARSTQFIIDRHSPELHYQRLMDVYRSLQT